MPSLLYRLGSDLGSKVRRRRMPIVGDDIKSQVGATITHRVRARLFEDRGVRLERTYQLNFGGQPGFPEHAGTIPAALEEDQQDLSRDLPDPHELRDANVHIAPAITLPFLLTASTRWCESNDEDSMICRCTWSTSLRCGTPQLGRHHQRPGHGLQDHQGPRPGRCIRCRWAIGGRPSIFWMTRARRDGDRRG